MHKTVVNLFYNITVRVGSVEHEVARRQPAVRPLEDNRFFSRARRLLLQYGLPNAYSLLENAQDKDPWKDMLNTNIYEHCEDNWKHDVYNNKKYLNPASVKPRQCHHVFNSY
ncbi:hypothetical protein DPMN_028174 [Dreissena polymorpha]|uniref:Uncharacterized protein n=1 Tax=Dreissena polymorpha TaxID=45954 RepID=A0A9D4LVS9_DREPO|nr:hypothetical protein DPMN_028174 [Dreissena polymorpha]